MKQTQLPRNSKHFSTTQLKGLVAFASVRLSLKYFNEGAKDPNLKYAYSAIVLLAVATGLLKKE